MSPQSQLHLVHRAIHLKPVLLYVANNGEYLFILNSFIFQPFRGNPGEIYEIKNNHLRKITQLMEGMQ